MPKSSSFDIPFEAIFNAAPDAIVVVDEFGKIILVNHQTELLFGYGKQELFDQPIEIFIPERYHKKHLGHRSGYSDNPVSRGMGANLELWGLKKDGTEFPVEISLSPIKNDGKTWISCAIRDVTEQKKINKLKEERDAQLNNIIENIPGAIYRCKASNSSEMLFVSEAFEEITRYPVSKFINHSKSEFVDLVHPEDLERSQIKIEKALKNKTGFDIIYRLIRKDGSIAWVNERGKGVYDKTGNLLYQDGTIFDITERKEMVDELALHEEILNEAQRIGKIGSWQYDVKTEKTFWSDYLYTMHNFDKNEDRDWVAESINCCRDKDRERISKAFEAAIVKGEAFDLELRFKPLNKEEIWIRSLGKPVFDAEGKVEQVIGNIIDITEYKKASEAMQHAKEVAESANRAKSEFLSNMSHELRTPLNGVLGYAQLLQIDENVTPKQKDSLEAIENCGQHLLTLINDVLDFSKIEAGRMELNNSPADLRKVLKGTADVIKQRANSSGLEFIQEFDIGLPQFIVADATKLRQVLINILGNAVKFTEKGSVKFKVEESNDQLRFVITDTGIGIPDEKLEAIFDPFSQFEGGILHGGTGLGLSICKRIIDLMKGTLNVSSKVGEGTTFEILIPLEEIEMEGQKAILPLDESVENPKLAPGQEFEILVTDDRETNRDIMVQLLEAVGFKAFTACDGFEALEMLEKHPKIAMVLMDIRMPGMNGIEATQKIRENEATKDKKVIAVTASVFPEFRKQALQSGFDDFIGKPFKTSEIFSKISHHLGFSYQNRNQEPDTETDKNDQNYTAINEEVLNKFEELLKVKNITAIKDLGHKLSQDASTQSTGVKIIELISKFDFNGLESFLKELK